MVVTTSKTRSRGRFPAGRSLSFIQRGLKFRVPEVFFLLEEGKGCNSQYYWRVCKAQTSACESVALMFHLRDWLNDMQPGVAKRYISKRRVTQSCGEVNYDVSAERL